MEQEEEKNSLANASEKDVLLAIHEKLSSIDLWIKVVAGIMIFTMMALAAYQLQFQAL